MCTDVLRSLRFCVGACEKSQRVLDRSWVWDSSGDLPIKFGTILLRRRRMSASAEGQDSEALQVMSPNAGRLAWSPSIVPIVILLP